ncbi:MAG: tetratricopeptide repeat protein, partial [Bryobacteraceae bacterium]
VAVLVLLVATAVVAAEPCAVCQSKEAAALARSGMGRSFRAVRGDVPDGEFRHAASGSTVQVRGATHAVRRGGRTVEGAVAYAVGSGNAGMSFLVRSGEWLFQSPASYFRNRRAWGPSPGYEKDTTLDFSRPIPEECVFCHAGSAEWVEGSVNRFRNPAGSLQGIPCERCHGAGTEHAERPSRGNIVNPVRLHGAQRDSVCEQCHLAGVTRVLNAGKRWRDFAPGGRLEDAWSVYVWPERELEAALHVVSHVEQLAASACAAGSRGQLWCGSCHRVHGQERDASAACSSCHASAQTEGHAAGRGSCAGCHMPKRPAADGGHTAFTDHRIQRRPKQRLSSARTQPGTLRAWRPAPNEARNEGLASIEAGDRLQSAELMQRGFRLLAERQREFERDPDVLAALGYVLLRKNRSREASTLLDHAVRLAPRNVRFRLNLGLALAESGDVSGARAMLEEVRRLDPWLDAARLALQQLPNVVQGPLP